jgi:hypothetical protein
MRRLLTPVGIACTCALGALALMLVPRVVADEPPAAAAAETSPWKSLEPGLDLGTFTSPVRSRAGDSLVHVLRVDPQRFDLVLRMSGATDEGSEANRTARAWAEDTGLIAAINSSMFQTDYVTSTELMVTAEHVNNGHVSSGRTVVAFDRAPDAPSDTPPFRIIDRDCEDLDAVRPRYRTLIQSIRMVSCKGENVWSDSKRVWSHAVVGIDTHGRALLIQARSPWSTHDFIDILRELPIDLDRLQYAEGGPEAQLYVNAGGVELERVGSFETGFFESDDNAVAWPIPNVIGVVRRATTP